MHDLQAKSMVLMWSNPYLPTIDQQRMIGSTTERNQLVHYATRHVRERMLRPLTHLGTVGHTVIVKKVQFLNDKQSPPDSPWHRFPRQLLQKR